MLLRVIHRELQAVADPDRAAGARPYMKSEMPFLGVSAVPLRAATKRIFAAHQLPSAAAWRKEVLSIWRKASYREERYAAIELTGVKRYREFQDLEALPMYEEMIVSGAWWDYVDVLAIHRVGEYRVRDFTKQMKKEMRRWSTGADLWKRRRASGLRSTRASSFCARPSAGRCANTRGRIRRKCSVTCARTRRSCLD